VVCDDQAAQRLGEELNADLVVWGSVPSDDQEQNRVYQIHFLMVKPGEASEIARALDGTEPDDEGVLERLKERARAVLAVVVGLSQSGNTEYAAAVDTFTQIVRSDWFRGQDFGVRAAIRLYLARALVAAGQWQQATGILDEILAEADYGWAYVAKGMIDLGQGRPAEDREVNCGQLARAGSLFRKVLTDPQLRTSGRSNVTYVDAKSHYGLGGVYLALEEYCDAAACCELDQAATCNPQACLDFALRELQAALDEYSRLEAPGEYLSEAHYGIGRVHHVRDDKTKAFEAYDRCVRTDPESATGRNCAVERDKVATPSPAR
jgi:tetratricopeptide (TPR) repeat protein